MDQKKLNRDFTDEEKHQIIQELLTGQLSKQKIWKKYTGRPKEHGQIIQWMRDLGYDVRIKRSRPHIASSLYNSNTVGKKPNQPDEFFENQVLKKRVEELEKKLKDAELRAIAYSTMVDIAEKEFKISIRKNLNTKP